jgi:hypothetical protein
LANLGRRRQRRWHFSDAGNRFNGKRRRSTRPVGKPISPSLKRGVIRCGRCGNRIVSNLDRCPFCQKNLLAPYQRFHVWLIAVVALGLGVFGFIYLNPPAPTMEVPKPHAESSATVVGKPAGASIKDLSFTDSIETDGLIVSVTSLADASDSRNGNPLKALSVKFVNKTAGAITLLSTQWRIEDKAGVRHDAILATTAEDQGAQGLANSFEVYELKAGATWTGRLFFADCDAAAIVYQPEALTSASSDDESLLVTWRVEAAEQQPAT